MITAGGNTTRYARPAGLDELLRVLEDAGEGACLLAGGTDLVPQLQAGRQVPFLVNLFRIEALRGIRAARGLLEIGAAVTVAALLRSSEVQKGAPLLWQAADRFASPLVRSRATVGGNLCNASPAADLSLALVALGADVGLASRTGPRVLPVEEFVLGPRRTALRLGEVVTWVRIPIAAAGRFERFEKSGSRPALEISAAATAIAATLEGRRVSDVRIACGAVAPVPMRARAAEALLAGRDLDVATIERAARAAAAEILPIDDFRATALHRRRLVAAFVRRSLLAALEAR